MLYMHLASTLIIEIEVNPLAAPPTPSLLKYICLSIIHLIILSHELSSSISISDHVLMTALLAVHQNQESEETQKAVRLQQ